MKKKPSNLPSLFSCVAMIFVAIFLVWAGYTFAMITQRPYSHKVVPSTEQNPSVEEALLSSPTKDTSTIAVTDAPIVEPATTPQQTQQVEVSLAAATEDADLEELRRQLKLFEATLKSCMGRYCIDINFPSGKNGAKQDRYGLLTPSKTAQSYDLYNSLHLLESDNSVFLYSSQVPTYGYGRNHGWTRIVRVVDNVAIQAYLDIAPYFKDADVALNTMGVKVSLKEAYTAQLRALLRWHCRLNHVAAHTSMLTVPSQLLAENPHFLSQSILSFLNVKDTKAFTEVFLQSQFVEKHFQYHRDKASRFDTIPEALRKLSASVIQEEMNKGKNMTKWPCLPFKELSKHLVGQDHRQFAPNCSKDAAGTGSYPKCSVQYDFAEQAAP